MRFTNLTRGAGIGSNCYRLDLENESVILDCGMHPEHAGHAATPLLEEIGEDSILTTILTHAHQDHVGCLPLLHARQPGMPVLMTQGTARIADIMLHNSVNVMTRQQEELKLTDYPLFTHRAIEMASRNWRHCPLDRPLTLHGERASEGAGAPTVTFHDAGHILGSAGVMIRAEGKKFFYTGDVNFEDQTIQTGARFPEEPVDVLLMETTRGNAPLPEGFTRAKEEKRFAAAVAAALEEGVSITIPVFALGKTQEVMALLWKMERERIIPPIPLYVGGLSSKITAVYDTMADRVPRNLPKLRLMNDVAPYVAGGKDVNSLNPRKRAIYALSSGMMTEYTLSNIFARKVLPDPTQYLFFVGYADPNSPAGHVRNAEPGSLVSLSASAPEIPFNCHREVFTFSAHARREDLLTYAVKVRPKTVLLVHGDDPAIDWFRRELYSALPETKVIAPPPGQPIEL
ncbi:MAG: MBL fold metallo-hydrolase [Verrucomicrobia bacterium]|nr:MAG: MBL fold metallo-hydrolase [Verrucomicrobiota bacterium]